MTTRQGQPLGSAAVRHDLDELLHIISDRFAYSRANDFDYEGAIATLAAGCRGGTTVHRFGFQVCELLAGFIDGHIRVEPYRLAEGSLPVILEPLQGRVLAVKPDRSAFMIPDLPYLESIDSVPLNRWLAAAARVVPCGTPQYVFFRSVEHLLDIQHWRSVLGLATTPHVVLGLTDVEGERSTTLTVPVAPGPTARNAPWPDVGSRVLDDNIGYLRLRSMRDETADHVVQQMLAFKDSRALIIDVRDNRGGLRSPLLALFPYLMAKDEDPEVGSVAAYRLWSGYPENHLDARSMFSLTSSRVGRAERRVIECFARRFEPELDNRNGGFSDWHYLLLSGPAPYHYSAPVIVIQNDKCFSATDIFLGALRSRPNVSLLGLPSSGGSAFGVYHTLPRSGVRIRMASMISFQPNGLLYDTRGIPVDHRVEPDPADFVAGGRDTVLAHAVRKLT